MHVFKYKNTKHSRQQTHRRCSSQNRRYMLQMLCRLHTRQQRLQNSWQQCRTRHSCSHSSASSPRTHPTQLQQCTPSFAPHFVRVRACVRACVSVCECCIGRVINAGKATGHSQHRHHTPAHAPPLQLPKPALHDATVLTPPAQPPTPFAAVATTPHAPQLLASVCTFTSHPSSASAAAACASVWVHQPSPTTTAAHRSHMHTPCGCQARTTTLSLSGHKRTGVAVAEPRCARQHSRYTRRACHHGMRRSCHDGPA